MKHKINKNEQIITSFVTLPDISCTSCASIIERSYKRYEGIEVTVNFATKRALFKYDANLWTEQKIIKTMKKIGYEVSIFQPIAKSSHEHSSAEHLAHIAKMHKQQRSFNASKKIALAEIVFGWILLLPMLLTVFISKEQAPFLFNGWWQLSLTTIIIFILGRKFYLGCFRELVKQKWPQMNTLVVFAATTAYIFSIYLIFSKQNAEYYFEVSSSIVMIVLLGDFISDLMQTKATSGLETLMNLKGKQTLLVTNNDDQGKSINIEDIKIDDQLLVRKGEAIPTDSILCSKNAYINESLLTGEAKAVTKNTNDNLIGGTINLGESIIVRAKTIGKDTVLAKIIAAVEVAEAQKPKLQKVADKVAAIFTPLIIVIAILVFFIRYFALQNSLDQSITISIATLIIACPCALGIATPLATAVGINKAAKNGVIYNEVTVFEQISKIDTICFDKTGTLTTGNITVKEIIGDTKFLNLAISLEHHSLHPVAQAFNKIIFNNPKEVLKLTNLEEKIGFGLIACYNNQSVVMASITSLLNQKMVLSQKIATFDFQKYQESDYVIALAVNNKIEMIFVLEDSIRPEAKTMIKKLQKKGINTILISGDHDQKTKKLATKLNISQYYAQVLPEEKAKIISELQASKHKVAFVGDGVNDSVALKQADLAIVMGSGSDIAKRFGAITIINNDISAVNKAIWLTKQTNNNIKLNFFWAFSYNLVIIPLAILGLVAPPIAAIAMAFSDILIVGNSLLFKLRKG